MTGVLALCGTLAALPASAETHLAQILAEASRRFSQGLTSGLAASQ